MGNATEVGVLADSHRSTHDAETAFAKSFRNIPLPLRTLRPSLWLLWFSFNWCVIVLALYSLSFSLLLLPLVFLIIGARQHALALLGHEAAHRLAFRTRWLNDAVSEVFIAWPLMLVINGGYRPWHFGHHRELGHDNDPELDYRRGRPYQGRVTWLLIARCFVMDCLGFGIPDLLYFMRLLFPLKKPYMLLGPLILWCILAVLFYHLDALWILGIWILSLFTTFWAVFRVRTFTEHVSLPPQGKETSHRFRANLLNRFLFFPHNTWCHYEHHVFPQIPFYHLPELRKWYSSRPVLRLRELYPLW